MIDTYSEDDRESLISIEKKIFQNIKQEVEEETGDWIGSHHQNLLADYKVSESIFKSFKSYEEGKKRVGTFFNFRKSQSSK